MTSLAFTPPKRETGDIATPVSPEEPRTTYPRLRMNGDQAEAAGLHKCALGDEYELTIRVKAMKLGGEDYEMRDSKKPPAEFDVISADKPVKVKEDSEDGEKEKKKARGVKTPKDSGFKDAYDGDE